MQEKLSIPAFVFQPVFKKTTTIERIKRQDDVLEIEFPVFEKNDVLSYAKDLSMQKYRAHDRPIDDLIEIMDQVGKMWMDPNYEFRKEAMRVIPMITGQSRTLCELELDGSIQLFGKRPIETFLNNEIGGKQYLENWITRGNIKLHAQPRGVLYHNLAGNTFNVGLVSLFYGLISKNVNLIKLPHEEPYFAVRLAQSLADVDKKLAKEMAIMYWTGSRGDIFDELFNSGFIDCIICWGGLRSIEDIRRRAYRYGIKVIDHGPKLSFSIVSEEILHNPEEMKKAARKIATDIVFWNQKACLSPRVIYLLEQSGSFAKEKEEKGQVNGCANGKTPITSNALDTMLRELNLKKKINGNGDEIMQSMQRSAKMLRNEMTDTSPLGFAKTLAEEMRNADLMLPRAHLTERDGMEMVKKREYFTLKYEINKNGVMFIPQNLNWTVMYLRTPPELNEIEMCKERFVIVTRLANLEELIQVAKAKDLTKFLQTISLFGSDSFVENAAQEFSMLGACRFPRLGEHNIQDMGAPWDGHFILQNMVRWCFIGLDTTGALNLTSNQI